MKVAVMIMAANMQPSIRNVEAFKRTVIDYQQHNAGRLRNNYDFYIYWNDENCDDIRVYDDENYPNVHNIVIDDVETVYRTFEKSIKAFKYVMSSRDDIDWFVRINISMFLNIELLDNALFKMNKGNMYCNAINSYLGLDKYTNNIYARGDLMIFDKTVMRKIIDSSDEFMYCDMALKNRILVDHVDDCLLGLCFIKGYGKDYYKRIYMLKYNFIPRTDITDSVDHIEKYAIGSRVKTIPQGTVFSGYSWDDNESRKFDCIKMEELLKYYTEDNKFDYSRVQLPDILVDKKKSRPTLFVAEVSNKNIYETFWPYLECHPIEQ